MSVTTKQLFESHLFSYVGVNGRFIWWISFFQYPFVLEKKEKNYMFNDISIFITSMFLVWEKHQYINWFLLQYFPSPAQIFSLQLHFSQFLQSWALMQNLKVWTEDKFVIDKNISVLVQQKFLCTFIVLWKLVKITYSLNLA